MIIFFSGSGLDVVSGEFGGSVICEDCEVLSGEDSAALSGSGGRLGVVIEEVSIYDAAGDCFICV